MNLVSTTWASKHLQSWRIRRWRLQATEIARRAGELTSASNSDLQRLAQELAWRCHGDATNASLICDAFGLVSEAARRVHGQTIFHEQIMAGLALVTGGIAEMLTGEGKTLASLLPAFLHALPGFGGHIITANDYLARRDADFAREVFERLGFSVGCVTNDVSREARRQQYDCHVTYATAHEIGFDFLRDALAEDSLLAAGPNTIKQNSSDEQTPVRVQRGLYFALVDEADSVLLDDARTPLLIASGERPSPALVQLYRWAQAVSTDLQAEIDYRVDHPSRSVRLSRHGCQRLMQFARPTPLAEFGWERIYRQVEHALTAVMLLTRDRDYIVRAEDVAIVDVGTGRIAEGRQWQDGLHQAVEVKEGMPPSALTCSAARVTLQNLFKRYRYVCGLTGTARGSEREFAQIYQLKVASIPPRRASQRTTLPPRIFRTRVAKQAAVLRTIEARLAAGQAVLVGTPSVSASEELSQLLSASRIEHRVLNCRYHAQEAEIVAQAGQAGHVTIATSMAGRGTDIKVSAEVLAAGGLHVIATEMQANRRIDLQLLGRTGRQGEPGSYELFLSLEDELWLDVDAPAMQKRQPAVPGVVDDELPASWFAQFRARQHDIERRHERERRELARWDREQERSCRKLGLNPLLETIE